MLKKHFIIWYKTALLSVQSSLTHRLGVVFFTLGKFLRFFLFIGFLVLIHSQVNKVGGYSLDQMLIFFLVFNLLDSFGQIFFRGIYWFRNQVISGEFDFRLVKPASPLFQALTRQTDILDVPLVFVTLGFLLIKMQAFPAVAWVPAGIMIVASLIIITAIHIIVAALGVMTTEVDHTIMIYRDISAMARLPVDIYTDSIRALLTFVIPVAVAFTFPAKALLGLLSFPTVIISFGSALVIFYLSLQLWHHAINQYSSASSWNTKP